MTNEDPGSSPADVAESRGEGARARMLREAALALVSIGEPEASGKWTLATRARALLAMNRLEEARPIVDRLTARGYRHPTLMKLWEQTKG